MAKGTQRYGLTASSGAKRLITRARQGFIIFIPNGDRNDITMLPDYYDGVYNYLKEIGIEEI